MVEKWQADLVLDARADLGEGPLWDARSGELLWVDIYGRARAPLRPGVGYRPGLRHQAARERDRHPRRRRPHARAAGRLRVVGRRHDDAGRSHRAAAARDPDERRRGRQPRPLLGRDDAHRRSPRRRRAVPPRRVRRGRGDVERRDDLERDRLEPRRDDDVLRRHADAVRSTPSTSTSKPERSPTVAASSRSTPNRALRTVWSSTPKAASGSRCGTAGRCAATTRTASTSRTVAVPAARVTKPAFGGPDLTDMFITTAAPEKPNPSQPYAGGLFHVRPGVAGLAGRTPTPASPRRGRRGTLVERVGQRILLGVDAVRERA